MKNNHGQVLVIFVILLPLLCLFAAYVVDASYISYEKNKLDNINEIVSDYIASKSQIEIEDIQNLIQENDKDIIIKKIDINNKIDIELEKEIKSIFGKIIGKNKYIIKSSITKNKNNIDNESIENNI